MELNLNKPDNIYGNDNTEHNHIINGHWINLQGIEPMLIKTKTKCTG